MELFGEELHTAATEAHCASLVMDMLPMLLGMCRGEWGQHHPLGLAMPQFRVMLVLDRHRDASLSFVADHLGTTLSSTSKLIERMVRHGYVTRETDSDDRRKIVLALTAEGRALFKNVYREALAQTEGLLAELSDEERETMSQAMRLLQRVLRVQAVQYSKSS